MFLPNYSDKSMVDTMVAFNPGEQYIYPVTKLKKKVYSWALYQCQGWDKGEAHEANETLGLDTKCKGHQNIQLTR